MGNRAYFALALGCSLATFVATAEAACPDGMVSNDATQGNCCWPGQVFSPDANRCVGQPACPSGMIAQGEQCVMSTGGAPVMSPEDPGTTTGTGTGTTTGTVTTQPSQGQPATGQPVAPAGYGTQPVGIAAAPPPATEVITRPRVGLIVVGAIMFGITYGIAALVAGASEDGIWAIPVAGPFVKMGELDGTDDFSGYGYAGLAVWGLAQAAGLTLLTLGIVLRQEVTVYARGLDLDGEAGGLAIMPQMFQEGAGGGLLLSSDF